MPQFLGISFPFAKGNQAFPEPVTDNDLIRQSLLQLILTGTNERVMRPTFGTDVRRFVFEPNDEVLANLIQSEVASVIARFEPRVTLRAVDIRRIDSEVVVLIRYVVNATQTADAVAVNVSGNATT